jgi:hypothetical protein
VNGRHAVALALVGWYLMIPPPTWKPPQPLPEHLQLTNWLPKRTFETQAECDRAITRSCHHLKNGEIAGLEGPLCSALCVSSDDPQLKSK